MSKREESGCCRWQRGKRERKTFFFHGFLSGPEKEPGEREEEDNDLRFPLFLSPVNRQCSLLYQFWPQVLSFSLRCRKVPRDSTFEQKRARGRGGEEMMSEMGEGTHHEESTRSGPCGWWTRKIFFVFHLSLFPRSHMRILFNLRGFCVGFGKIVSNKKKNKIRYSSCWLLSHGYMKWDSGRQKVG